MYPYFINKFLIFVNFLQINDESHVDGPQNYGNELIFKFQTGIADIFRDEKVPDNGGLTDVKLKSNMASTNSIIGSH